MLRLLYRVTFLFTVYLGNIPWHSGGWYTGEQCPWLKDCAKNEKLAEKDDKRSFEGDCEMLRAISLPWALSTDIPTSRKGFLTIWLISKVRSCIIVVTQENRDFFENRMALLNFENASIANFNHLKLQIHYIWLTLMEVSIETCFSKFKSFCS